MDLRLRTRPPLAHSREGATIIEVAGELDLHSAPQLRAEAVRAIEMQSPPRVIVDLSGVTFLDSTGVGVLVGALKRAREAGGALQFCGPQTRVCRVFEITGLIGALPLFKTREEALAAFDAEPGENVVSEETAAPAPAPQPLAGAALSVGESP